jgi:hypothetical protein
MNAVASYVGSGISALMEGAGGGGSDRWDPNAYSPAPTNSSGPAYEHYGSYETHNQTHNHGGASRLSQQQHGGAWVHDPLPVLDIRPNPVKDLAYVESPYDTQGSSRGPGVLSWHTEHPKYCVRDIPSKEVRQTREDMGGEMADYSRWGRGAGAGVAASKHRPPLSGTQQVQHGPVPVSGPEFNDALYDQGFISMSAVPAVHAGKYKDPITGVEYDTYESAMPPPDTDCEETINAPARNVKLAHLQGGWRDTTPRPTKREVVEDDFNLQYDRGINAYGTYDSARYVERFERNNRFTRDNEHPDSEGPVVVGTPANFSGNQNVKIRPMPYLPPTNRGKWAETTFRDGIDPSVAVGNADQMVAQTYTRFPCERMENTRQDGGGMQPTQNYEGFTLLQTAQGSHDVMPTQRSTSEHRMPNVGPAGTTVSAAQLQDMQVAPATKSAGQRVNPIRWGVNGGSAQAHASQPQDVAVPNALTGTQTLPMGTYTAVDNMQQGAGGSAQSVTLRNAEVVAPNATTGLRTYEKVHGSHGVTAYAQQHQQNLLLDAHTSKGGMRVQGSDDAGGQHGVMAYGQQHQQNLLLDAHTSKGGMRVQGSDDAGGQHGATAYGQQHQKQIVGANISKGGMHLQSSDDSGGQYGATAHAGQVKPQFYGAQNKTKREILELMYTAFDPNSGASAQANTARVTKFNTKKGAAYDVRIPSGSLGGTENMAFGAQNWGAVTRLNSKKGDAFREAAVSVAPDDSVRMRGHYNQRADGTDLNSRQFGNFSHPMSSASATHFMTQLQNCGF